MKVDELRFERPERLSAREPAELRGIPRDGVRLLVSTPDGVDAGTFRDLPKWLQPGDLLVVNQSQVMAASLPAKGLAGAFRLNISTGFGRGLYLAEPRHSFAEPGPLAVNEGDSATVGPAHVTFIANYPGMRRLWFVHSDRPLERLMQVLGSPIRYGYTEKEYPLSFYATVFGRFPGSAEMPSASRPFTPNLVRNLRTHGVRFATVVLHAGVSSLEVEGGDVESFASIPEPFAVPERTVRAIEATHRNGHRVIAVGTTVVRALESAWSNGQWVPTVGTTRRWVTPERGVHSIDGLLTGFHDSRTTHLALLYAIAGRKQVERDYARAIAEGYLWHEFGDSHFLLNH